MKILYISMLEGYEWQGPTHSTPMQIGSQAELDDVLWVNLRASICESWKEKPYYLEMKNGLKTRFADLPEAFQNPDLVVFEGVYEYPFVQIAREIWARKIPYVLVPRSALTRDAQKKKPLKKWVGNLLFFNKFVRKAAAIQYLTEAERADSARWKTPSFVAPNGILPKEKRKSDWFADGGLSIVYVGRIEKYQKGLDLLIEACASAADDLRGAGATICLRGPDREGSCKALIAEIERRNLGDLIFVRGPVFGEEKEKALLNADLFLMTSRFEGLPMGMIEALAYGLPVAATPGTNMADAIEKADAGWTCDGSVEGIADMLRRAVSDRSVYQAKADAALELSKAYNWNSIAEATRDQYREMVKS